MRPHMRLYRLALLLAMTLLSLALCNNVVAGGRVHVRGYVRKNGTYVAPHYRTAPDGNPFNNYNFPGNFNPNKGTITPGNPDTYLRRYYEKRGAGSDAVPAQPSVPDAAVVLPSGSPAVPSVTPEPRAGAAPSLPEHAHIDYLGHSWECDRGFSRAHDGCEKLVLPEHAHIDYLGHSWECDRGFYQARDHCEKLGLPEHAHIDYLGHSWECDRGFYQARDGCLAIGAKPSPGPPQELRPLAGGTPFSLPKLPGWGGGGGASSPYEAGSGHDAGYRWAEEHDIDDPDDCGGNSDSFIEGCQEYAEEQQATQEDEDEEGEDGEE